VEQGIAVEKCGVGYNFRPLSPMVSKFMKDIDYNGFFI
jgi:hypothetical protein